MSSDTDKNSYKQETGARGEDEAVLCIQQKGYSIIDRNYRAGRSGEIDIIARSGNTIVFFEVKTRNSSSFGGAIYSISKKKIETLKYCARHYIHRALNDCEQGLDFRFDLLSVEKGRVEWVEDIIRW